MYTLSLKYSLQCMPSAELESKDQAGVEDLRFCLGHAVC